MTAALVLLLGVTAALFPTGGRPAAWRGAGGRLGVAQVVVLVLGALLGAPVLGLPWWQAAAAAGLAGLWTAATRLAPAPRATLWRWGAAIAVIALCAVLQGEPQAAAGRAARLCQGAGCLLLLTTPANRAVTDLLAIARGRVRPDGETRPGRDGETRPDWAPLRGGRWIGPLERLLLLLLASMGVHAAVAAVIAAKGVIRFPEISRDERGDKAEEFLIGSLASWALAVLAAMLLTRP